MLTLQFISVFLLFAHFYGVFSIVQFQTYQGCNATFVCYHTFGVLANWTNSLGPLTQGPKVIITNTNYYSVLTLTSVATADKGNISCIRKPSETLVFTLNVQEIVQCRDIYNTDTCKATVDGGDDCTKPWMRTNCQKSCGLCPKFNCTKSEEPTAGLPLPTTRKATVIISGVESSSPPTQITTVTSFPASITPRVTQAIDKNSSCGNKYQNHHMILATFLLIIDLFI